MTEPMIKEAVTSTPASTEPKCGDLLINSPVVMDGSSMTPDVKRKEKPVPHYLRASTSSCHDNCKFGIKHSSEPKKYWPVSRKQLRRASTGNQELDRVQIILPQKNRPIKEDQKLKISHVKGGSGTVPAKPEFITLKAPLEKVPDHLESIPHVEDSSAEASDLVVAETLPTDAECFVVSHDDVTDCGDGESLDGAESIELEMPLAIQDIDESDEHIEDTILPADSVCGVEGQSPVRPVPDQSENECASSEIRTPQTVIASEKHEQAKLGTKSESLSKGSVKPKAKATLSMTRDKGSSKKSGRTPHLTSTRTAVDSSGGPKTARKPADVTATTKFSNPERKFRPTVTSTVQKAKEIKFPSASNAKDSSAKPSRLAKLKASITETAPSPSLSSAKQTDRKMSGSNVGKNAQILPKKREDKVKTGTLKLSRSLNMSAKSLSGVKLRTVRKEKIAPPINSSKKVSGTENSSIDAKEAKQRILKTASPKVRKLETNNKEIGPRKAPVFTEKIDTARIATARRPKHAPATTLSTVMPAQPPRKLTFRRGKVLNPDESSGSTPRRLRFRPAIAAADATARSRGGRIASRRTGGGGGAAARGAGAEVVVLRRRQDGKETKKQEPGLFNNVIEETASRLVAEARKSKVKALVGAFETVISLQETSKAAAPAMAAGAVVP
ncbi:uncharacterized protein [Miscanthus floridulus]|uniref:uncharacterized protein isoform X1 n=1 Tax=Miscanthus floridulus TaxID=154761 RepID=UPI00345B40BA